ncbi:C40 family peptidase [Mucilaginibacter ginsenosidivorans]|uniref:Glycoside hydrolase n=1 Tax=Mucilaginibacter ginsenosidivorans TaxID=398053 RepID=A0A5B8UUM3_9SPHI|nr:NlpC/P60 family protein [Mucilaginibacter ginsenosidivorans]QEC62609.1 glycoside hydrolase [Mucilaginibacter ginsenosidivorans]
MKKYIFAILLSLSIVAAQAQTKSAPTPPADKDKQEEDGLVKDYFSQIMGVALSTTSNVKLFQFVYDWIGTPYHFGGDSKKGIDCSAFTKELYSKVFNLTIKRNSRDIFSMVSPVRKDDLKEGDLVFFKIHSRSISHVGIYLGDGKFAHASSRGVAINSLEDGYYSRYFYKGGRLLDVFKKQLEDEDDSPDDSNKQ